MDLGIVVAYFGNNPDTVQTGNEEWIYCDGREICRTDYSDLYTVIADTYGHGNDHSTFNIPDLRGYFMRGLDVLGKRDPDVLGRSSMNNGGLSGANVGSVQNAQTGPHQHTLSGWVCVLGCCCFQASHDVVDLNSNDGNSACSDFAGGPDVTPKNASVNFLILAAN